MTVVMVKRLESSVRVSRNQCLIVDQFFKGKVGNIVENHFFVVC